MSEIPQFKEVLIDATVAYEVERDIQTVQALDADVFTTAIGGHDPLHSRSIEEEDAIIDAHEDELDEFDDRAARLFGEVEGYHLQSTDIGRLTIAKELEDGSVWGPFIRKRLLTANIDPTSGILELSKVVVKGKVQESDKITEVDRRVLAQAIVRLTGVTEELKEL